MYNGKRIVATIEARMTSTRLPGKVLLDLAGMPVLEVMKKRIDKSKFVDEVVVATTVNKDDDSIVRLCGDIGCSVSRGSEDDVLSRVMAAAEEFNADIIVELTGDCPFIDPVIIDDVLELYFSGNYDYASNVVKRTFPDGFDVEVFSLENLRKVDVLTNDPIDRVHVSTFFYQNPDKFSIANLEATEGLKWPELGITLDERKDYEMLMAIADKLADVETASASNIVELIRTNLDILEINKDVRRKEICEG